MSTYLFPTNIFIDDIMSKKSGPLKMECLRSTIGCPVVVVLTNVRHVQYSAVAVHIIAQFETFSNLPLLAEKQVWIKMVLFYILHFI